MQTRALTPERKRVKRPTCVLPEHAADSPQQTVPAPPPSDPPPWAVQVEVYSGQKGQWMRHFRSGRNAFLEDIIRDGKRGALVFP